MAVVFTGQHPNLHRQNTEE